MSRAYVIMNQTIESQPAISFQRYYHGIIRPLDVRRAYEKEEAVTYCKCHFDFFNF